MRVTLFHIRLPELEHLPPSDRQAVIDRGNQAAEIQRLWCWYLWLLRSIFLGLAASAVLGFLCCWLECYPRWLWMVLFVAPFAAIFGWIVLLLWYRHRLTAEWRRLLQTELASRPQRDSAPDPPRM